MENTEENNKPTKTKSKTNDKVKTPKIKNNTMDITIINSLGTIIHATGACTDKEYKAFCRMIHGCEAGEINLSNSV